MRLGADIIEGLALLAIGVAVAVGGHPLLRELHVFEPAAVVMLGLGVLGLALSIRRVLAGGMSADVRLAITVRAAYFTGVVLAIVAVVTPARWSSGAAIAMIDIAIVFDLFARYTSARLGPSD